MKFRQIDLLTEFAKFGIDMEYETVHADMFKENQYKFTRLTLGNVRCRYELKLLFKNGWLYRADIIDKLQDCAINQDLIKSCFVSRGCLADNKLLFCMNTHHIFTISTDLNEVEYYG